MLNDSLFYCDESFNSNKLSYSTFQIITFQAAQNAIALDMTNRIIKSLDCCKIILIFCILEVDFAISVITLFMVFNEAFQKALVYKSVCVINIALLIVLPSIKIHCSMVILIGSLHFLQ